MLERREHQRLGEPPQTDDTITNGAIPLSAAIVSFRAAGALLTPRSVDHVTPLR
jgi:hypothetical protein